MENDAPKRKELLALVGGAMGDFNCLSIYLCFLIFLQCAGRKVDELLGKNHLVPLLSFVVAGGLCWINHGYDGYDLSSQFLLEANLGWEGTSQLLWLSAKLLTNLNMSKAGGQGLRVSLYCILNLPYIKSAASVKQSLFS